MSKDNPKYESHFYGSVQGVVIGDNNTVTFIFQSGEQQTVPFLAPPRPSYYLTGRDELLHDLKQQLLAGKSLALSALNGLPGVGKTALAIELAHDRNILAQFHDGILWAGLGRRPDVLAVLSTWGTALGISSDEIAKLTGIEDWAKAIHTAIAMRRMLLVVDDAWQVEEALAFRVGGPNCAHVLTTRLPEVALRFAGEGVRVVHELSEADGLALLARLAPGLIETEPEEARALVQAVGGLPLALTLMGNYLRVQAHSGQPRRLLAALNRLHQAEERLRLEQPQAPLERHPSIPFDTPLSLLASISISEQALDEQARYVLWTLSIFPPKPNNFSEAAALAVSDRPVEAIDMLTDYGLLESSGAGRYTLHQTIADYARIKHNDATAYERMVKFFVNYIEDHETDLDLLDPETNNVIAALQAAFDLKMWTAMVRGVMAFYHFLEFRGLYTLAEFHLNRAREAARFVGDIIGEITTLINLGRIEEKRGNLEQAEGYYQEALVLARKFEKKEQISDILKGLGWVIGMRGNYEQAETYFLEGLAIARKIEQYKQISALLQGLAWAAQMQGNYEQAETYFLEGLAIARKIGNREQVSDLLQGLGWMMGMRGDFEQAEAYFLECLALAVEIGSREYRINPLLGLGWVKGMHGDYEQAETYFLECLALVREIGHREEMTLLANLGWVTRERGDLEQAEVYFRDALSMARKAGHSEKVSLMLTNLGEVECRRRNYTQAEVYLQEGLAIAREIGSRERIIDPLQSLCLVASERGEYEQAEMYLQEGLALAREIENRWLIGVFLNERGELYLKQQKLASASSAFLESLETSQEVGNKDFNATVLYNLAQVAAAQGNIAEAKSRGQESLAIFEVIGHSKMTEVRQWLAALPLVDISK
jgi:tetratricopeptide (TPR) repeat protein